MLWGVSVRVGSFDQSLKSSHSCPFLLSQTGCGYSRLAVCVAEMPAVPAGRHGVDGKATRAQLHGQGEFVVLGGWRNLPKLEIAWPNSQKWFPLISRPNSV